jgi:hypothetical protein
MKQSPPLILFVALSFAACATCVAKDQCSPAPDLGAFVPTPVPVVERMLELAAVTKDDVVYDLGSGDGRIVIMAAKRYGARGVGVEIDPLLLWFSRKSAQQEGVTHLARFWQHDALTADLTQATVVTLYLTREANLLLRPILRERLRPGARVVSHAHDMGDWTPERVERILAGSGDEHIVYLWRIH